MNDVDQALRDIVALCDEMGVEYAVMGGLAVRVHSLPRATHDVDLALSIDRSRLPEFFAKVSERGYAVPESYLKGWIDEVAKMSLVKVRVYLPGGGVDVDIYLAETPFLREAISRRILAESEAAKMYVVSAEDLLLLKLLANRPRDRVDVLDILFMQGELDEAYMHRWAAQLGVSEALAQALANRPGDERP